jgi:hypothetical protein
MYIYIISVALLNLNSMLPADSLMLHVHLDIEYVKEKSKALSIAFITYRYTLLV